MRPRLSLRKSLVSSLPLATWPARRNVLAWGRQSSKRKVNQAISAPRSNFKPY